MQVTKQMICTIRALIKLINKPQQCLKCGWIGLEDNFIVELDEQNQGLDSIFGSIFVKSVDDMDEISQNFLFDDKPKCVERVTQNLLSNVEEYVELQNSLNELNSLISNQEKMIQYSQNEKDLILQELQENHEIQERMENALKINLNQKQILKEILIKIGDENKKYIQNLQIQIRQQQLDMLNLLKINQDLSNRLIKYDQESKSKISYKQQLDLSNDKYITTSEKIMNPFEENKLNFQSEDLIAMNSVQFQNLQQQESRKNLMKIDLNQKSYNSIDPIQQKSAKLRYQSNAKASIVSSGKSEKENFRTAQSQIDSDDAYISVENISDRKLKYREHQPIVAQIKLTQDNPKIQDQNHLGNSRYHSNAQQQPKQQQQQQQQQVVLKGLSNLQTMQMLNESIRFAKQSPNLRSSSENNPLSSYESETYEMSGRKQEMSGKKYERSGKKQEISGRKMINELDGGSPQIKQCSRTLASQFGKGGNFINKATTYSSNMLILD